MERIATAEWVDRQLEKASTAGLAGAVFSLAMALGPEARRWILRDALEIRVFRELSQFLVCGAEARADILCLLGAAAFMGVSCLKGRVDWPNSTELNEALELWRPGLGRVTLGSVQAVLWLGLREMAKMGDCSVSVAPHLGNAFLNLWVETTETETAEALPPPVRALNVEMIAWLRLCRAAGWRLVPPPPTQ
jgi:hypothetical protein